MSSPQVSGSSLSDVVYIPKRLGSWPKLDNDESLALLHAKFGAHINDAFDQFGPTARLCISYSQSDLDEHERDVSEAIQNISLGQLKGLVTDAECLNMHSISHKICLVSRADRENVHSQPIITPITPSIQSRLANQFRNLEQDEQLRLYHQFLKAPDSRVTAGIFFEALGQRQLQDRIILELVPMVKLDNGRRKRLPQWHSSHVLLNNLVLENSRQQALSQSRKIDTKPSGTKAFTDNGPSSIVPNVFYIPEASNHEALNAFILFDGDLFIFKFQFTIGAKHGIKPGLLSFFKPYLNLPLISHWRFVFIIPHNLTLTCLQSWCLDLRGMPLFSAVIDTSDWK
jgi:hypothetical protein